MRLRKLRGTCRIRHRFSRWAHVKHDYGDGFDPEVNPDTQFRMCVNCGHQELREKVCESS